MKNAIIYLTMMVALIPTTFAGQEAGNGGQSIYDGDNAYLRDIFENNNCKWRSGNLMLKKVSKLENVLNSIHDIHWITYQRQYTSVLLWFS